MPLLFSAELNSYIFVIYFLPIQAIQYYLNGDIFQHKSLIIKERT